MTSSKRFNTELRISAPARDHLLLVEGATGSASGACGRAARARPGRMDRGCCASSSARLSSDAGLGHCAQADRPASLSSVCSDLTAGAAELSRRALDPRYAPEPALAGDAVHAAVHGLVWLAFSSRPSAGRRCSWSTTCTGRTRRRCGGWPSSRRRLRRATARRAVRGANRRATGANASCSPSCSRRPRAAAAAAAAWPHRSRSAGRRTLPDRRSAFAHAYQAVTAGNQFLLPALLDHLGRAARARARPRTRRGGAFGPTRSPWETRTSSNGSSTVPARSPARSRSSAASRRCATPRDLALLERTEAARRRRPRCGPPASLHGDAADTRCAPADRQRPLRQPRARANAPSGTPTPHACSRDERAGAERVALHLLRTDGNWPTTRRSRRCGRPPPAADCTRRARRAPSVFLRRALAEPPLDPRPPRPSCASSSGSRARRTCSRTPPRSSTTRRARRLARPARRASRSPGARALGPRRPLRRRPSHLCRRGLEDAAERRPPTSAQRLEAELILNDGDPGRHGRREPRAAATRAGAIRPAGAVARSTPPGSARARRPPGHRGSARCWRRALEDGASSIARWARCCRPSATLVLIANDDLDSAIARCGSAHRPRSPARLADRARARELHACDGPACGPARIRDAETDARLALRVQACPQPRPCPDVGPAHARRRADRGGPARRRRNRAGSRRSTRRSARGRLRRRRCCCRPARAYGSAGTSTPMRYADLEAAAQGWRELGTQHPGLAVLARRRRRGARGALGRRAPRPGGSPRSTSRLAERVATCPARRRPACARWRGSPDGEERHRAARTRRGPHRRRAGPARAHARARRPRRRAGRANRRADAQPTAAPRARPRRPPRHAPARPPRSSRAAGRRRPPPPPRAHRPRRPHPYRAPRRHARRQRATATPTSPSSSTSPAARSRRTSPTRSRSSTSPTATSSRPVLPAATKRAPPCASPPWRAERRNLVSQANQRSDPTVWRRPPAGEDTRRPRSGV